MTNLGGGGDHLGKYVKDGEPPNQVKLIQRTNLQFKISHCKLAHQSQSQNGAPFPSSIWSIKKNYYSVFPLNT